MKQLLITCRKSFTYKLHVVELHDYSLVKWLGNGGTVVLSQVTTSQYRTNASFSCVYASYASMTSCVSYCVCFCERLS